MRPLTPASVAPPVSSSSLVLEHECCNIVSWSWSSGADGRQLSARIFYASSHLDYYDTLTCTLDTDQETLTLLEEEEEGWCHHWGIHCWSYHQTWCATNLPHYHEALESISCHVSLTKKLKKEASGLQRYCRKLGKTKKCSRDKFWDSSGPVPGCLKCERLLSFSVRGNIVQLVSTEEAH